MNTQIRHEHTHTHMYMCILDYYGEKEKHHSSCQLTSFVVTAATLFFFFAQLLYSSTNTALEHTCAHTRIDASWDMDAHVAPLMLSSRPFALSTSVDVIPVTAVTAVVSRHRGVSTITTTTISICSSIVFTVFTTSRRDSGLRRGPLHRENQLRLRAVHRQSHRAVRCQLL